jgi:hypothetical protein
MTNGDRLCLHEHLATHLPALRFAAKIMSLPPDALRRLDPVEEQYLEDAAGHYGAVVMLLEAALKRTWEERR